jgi:hypothetical protein
MTAFNRWLRGAMMTLALGAAVAAASMGPAVAAAMPKSATPAVEVCGVGPAVARPASVILTCADEGERAVNLHWSSWTATKATATGTVIWRACLARCADSRHWDSASAKVTLTKPEREPGSKLLFTRLDLSVTGHTPPGFMRNLAFNEAPVPAASLRPATPSPAARSAAPQPAAAPSGSLGYAQIEGFWIVAGGPDSADGSYTYAQVAAAITGAESSFLPGIIQPGVDYCGAGADKAGWGLWQITCGNSVPAYGTDFQLLDPWNNAEAAVSKFDADEAAGFNGFDPWATYTSGAYTNFLQPAAPDMSLTDPGEYVPINATPPGTPSSPAASPGSTYGPAMPGTQPPPPPAEQFVFWKNSSGYLTEDWTTTNSSTWHGAVDFPSYGVLGSQPTVAVDRATGEEWVFWATTSFDLGEAWYTPASGWQNKILTSITGVASAPSAGVDGQGNQYVFWRTSSGQLGQAWYGNGTWHASGLAPANLASPPAVAVDNAGDQFVFYRDTSGELAEYYYISGAWQAPRVIESSISGTPSAGVDPTTDEQWVFWKDSSGNLAETWYVPNGSWHAPIVLNAGVLGSGPSVAVDDSGNQYVFWQGQNNLLYEATYTASWSYGQQGDSVTSPPAAASS